jgi:hypothetical protein
MIGNESFNVVVNGYQFESTFIESIFLSPAVEEVLASNFNCRQFYISDSSIDSNDFSFLLDFIRCNHSSDCSSVSISTSASSSKTFSTQKSFLSICRSLQNKQLKLMSLILSDEIFGLCILKVHQKQKSTLITVHLNSIRIRFPLFLVYLLIY